MTVSLIWIKVIQVKINSDQDGLSTQNRDQDGLSTQNPDQDDLVRHGDLIFHIFPRNTFLPISTLWELNSWDIYELYTDDDRKYREKR